MNKYLIRIFQDYKLTNDIEWSIVLKVNSSMDFKAEEKKALFDLQAKKD